MPQHQILPQRTEEETRILREVAHLATDVIGVDMRHINAVDNRFAFRGLRLAREQLQQRRLSGTGFAENGNALARLNLQLTYLYRLLALLFVIAVLQALDLVVTRQHRAVGHFFVGLFIERLFQQLIQSGHRWFRMLPAREDHRQLHQRRNRTRGKQATGDQGTGRDPTIQHQIAAEHQHPGVGDLLDSRGPSAKPCAPHALFHADCGTYRMGVLPLALEIGFRLQGFDILDPFDRFDQHRVTDSALAHPLFRQLRHRPLHQQARNNNQRDGDQRNRHQRAAHQRHNAKEQENKGHIHRRADGSWRQKLAHLVNFTELGDEWAGGFGTRVVFDGHRPRKEQRGDLKVDVLTHNVGDMGSRKTNKILKRRRHQHAEEQHPQGRDRLRRNNPVIHLHWEKDRPQRQHVANNRSQRNLAQLASAVAEMTPEPVCFPGTGKLIDTRIAPACGDTQ